MRITYFFQIQNKNWGILLFCVRAHARTHACVCVCVHMHARVRVHVCGGGGASYGEACLCVVVFGVILFWIILLLALVYTIPSYMI